MIQAVVTRQAGNSFLIRGWTVTLTVALLALAANGARGSFVIVAYFPAIMFWCLDAYYLRQERLFASICSNNVSDFPPTNPDARAAREGRGGQIDKAHAVRLRATSTGVLVVTNQPSIQDGKTLKPLSASDASGA